MKKLLLIAITALMFIACENTTEPKDTTISVNEIENETILCKRIWLNNSSYSYSIKPDDYGVTLVDTIKLSKGFGSFTIEYYKDSTWTMKTAESVRYIRL